MLMKILLWFLGLFGYQKEAAAVAAYQAEGRKEEAEAAAELAAQEERVEAQEVRDHETVASASDPDAAVDAELRADGILAGGEDPGARDPGAGG